MAIRFQNVAIPCTFASNELPTEGADCHACLRQARNDSVCHSIFLRLTALPAGAVLLYSNQGGKALKWLPAHSNFERKPVCFSGKKPRWGMSKNPFQSAAARDGGAYSVPKKYRWASSLPPSSATMPFSIRMAWSHSASAQRISWVTVIMVLPVWVWRSLRICTISRSPS